MNKKPANGFSSLVLLILAFIVLVTGGLYVSYIKIPFIQKLITGVDKRDSDWKMAYCGKEIAKLPAAPFTFKSKSDVIRTGPSLYTRKMMPEGLKYSDVVTCSYAYRFDVKTAWTSVGVEYKNHIDNANQFSDTSSQLFVASMGRGWKKLPRIARKDSGLPGYVTDSFPLVFTRENRMLHTMEYLDVFPAVDFHVKLSVYEK